MNIWITSHKANSMADRMIARRLIDTDFIELNGEDQDLLYAKISAEVWAEIEAQYEIDY